MKTKVRLRGPSINLEEGWVIQKGDEGYIDHYHPRSVSGISLAVVVFKGFLVNVDIRYLEPIPYSPKEICKQEGHAMFLLYKQDNGGSVWGQHKCSRCGYEEDFQCDYG